VFFPGFRVSNDTFYSAIMEEFPARAQQPIRLSPTELMGRAMQHMHPLKTVFLRHSTMYPEHMENLLWPVGDQGYVLREYISHTLFAMNPSEIEVNNYSIPVRQHEADRIHWVSGSDEVLFVSLGPMARDQHWYENGSPVNANSVAMKSLELDSPIVPPLIRRRFRFHGGITNESEWRTVERASDLFTHRVSVAREALLIWRQLDREGCSAAASLLLHALLGRSLSHAVNFAAPVTIFCPVNRNLPDLGDPRWEALVAEGPTHTLRRRILAHVVPGRFSMQDLNQLKSGSPLPGGRITVRKTEYDVRVNDVQIVRPDIACGNHIIHLVEAPLFGS